MDSTAPRTLTGHSLAPVNQTGACSARNGSKSESAVGLREESPSYNSPSRLERRYQLPIVHSFDENANAIASSEIIFELMRSIGVAVGGGFWTVKFDPLVRVSLPRVRVTLKLPYHYFDSVSLSDTFEMNGNPPVRDHKTVESLTKNHPKNALGYALSVQADEETAGVFREYVIDSVDDGRNDAQFIGLVTYEDGNPALTTLGREAVRSIVFHHGDVDTALERIDAQYGSSKRFTDSCPTMAVVTRHALLSQPLTQTLVTTIDSLMRAGNERPTLAAVAKAVGRDHPNIALRIFPSKETRDRVRSGSGGVNLNAFDDGRVYSTHTTFQYKAVLYHVGLLTERGTDTKSDIDPSTAIWALETPL